jgi:hypothetical protein
MKEGMFQRIGVWSRMAFCVAAAWLPGIAAGQPAIDANGVVSAASYAASTYLHKSA